MGAQLEVSPAAFKIAHKVGEVLQGPGDQQGHGGSALIVDYGAEKAFGDSLRVRILCVVQSLRRACIILRHLKTTKLWTFSTDRECVI